MDWPDENSENEDVRPERDVGLANCNSAKSFSSNKTRYNCKIVELYLNHDSAHPNELVKPVKDDDEIHLIIMLAGG